MVVLVLSKHIIIAAIMIYPRRIIIPIRFIEVPCIRFSLSLSISLSFIQRKPTRNMEARSGCHFGRSLIEDTDSQQGYTDSQQLWDKNSQLWDTDSQQKEDGIKTRKEAKREREWENKIDVLLSRNNGLLVLFFFFLKKKSLKENHAIYA